MLGCADGSLLMQKKKRTTLEATIDVVGRDQQDQILYLKKDADTQMCIRDSLQPAYEDFNKMSKELQSIQTLRSDFINHFSHEFKTPITAIKGFAELLREPDTTPEEREQYLQIILDESSHLADLANSTLLLTRLESQQFIAEKRPYPLDEQIKRCAILLSPSWEKKQISFTASLEPAEFVGNEELMRHVWINLLDNAVKYTPEAVSYTHLDVYKRQIGCHRHYIVPGAVRQRESPPLEDQHSPFG